MARWKVYFSLEGRASRLAFWRFFLLQSLVAAGLMVATSFATIIGGWLGAIPALLFAPLLVAGFCLTARRLHDRGKSVIWAVIFAFGPFTLAMLSDFLARKASTLATLTLVLTSLAGLILTIWGWIELGVRRGQKGANRFGPDPYGRTAPAPAE